ncbi:MAG: hypothetical protein AAGF12_25525 [Myxococcota bacterium]
MGRIGEVVRLLLRDPEEVARRCREGEGLREVTLTSLLLIAVGAAVFGTVLGSHRGDLQLLYSGIKLPLAILATLVVCGPAFHAIAATLHRPWPMRTVIGLVLASAARSSLVLLAVAPLLWLAIDLGISYHAAVILAALGYAVSGVLALGVLVRGLEATRGRLLTAAACALVFFAVGGQTAWSLRPYLGRPAQAEVPFVRDREGTFADAVVVTAQSAFGFYRTPAQDESRPHESVDPGSVAGDAPLSESEPMGTRRSRR